MTKKHPDIDEEQKKHAKYFAELRDWAINTIEQCGKYRNIALEVFMQTLSGVFDGDFNGLPAGTVSERVLNPYFARIEYRNADWDYKRAFIGDQDFMIGRLQVWSWKSRMGNRFYNPDEALLLKREFKFSDGRIIDLIDTLDRRTPGFEKDLIVNENTLLINKLDARNAMKLENIIDTLQKHQNHVIRLPHEIPLIINGVAGSGKTTIAYLRMSYLLYPANETGFQAKNMIIFAANRIILNYAQSLSKHQGLQKIQQTTFEDWALKQLMTLRTRRTKPVELQDFTLKYLIDNPRSYESKVWRQRSQILGSPEMETLLQELVNDVSQKIKMPKKPLDFTVSTKKVSIDLQLEVSLINTIYQDILSLQLPYSLAREKFIKNLANRVYQDFLSVRNLHKNRKFVIKILISVINTVLGKYWRSINPQREFIRILSDQKRLSDLAKNLLSSKQQDILFTTSENRKKFGQAIGKDEIASILLLHWLLNGIPTNKFDHIVIDEAQDLSSLHFILLKRCSNNSMTILGDISQGIYSYRGIQSWKKVQDVFANIQIQKFVLKENFRSTQSIVEFNNHVSKEIFGVDIPQAIGTGRKGQHPKIVEAENVIKQTTNVVQEINLLKAQGIETITIFTRDILRAFEFQKDLLDHGIESQVFEHQSSSISGGISIFPVYMVKGLEFSVVLLIDANLHQYDPKIKFEAKLLFVALSRALHHLVVFSSSELTPLLTGVRKVISENQSLELQEMPVIVNLGLSTKLIDRTNPTQISPYASDPLDATRGIGFMAREEGRFGSMPSYDDYGEESEP